MANQNTIVGNIGGNIRHKKIILWSYSSPRLVVDWMEELIVGLLLVENAWCQKQSWSFMHLLCSGMVGFGLRQKLGTAGTERHSPPSSSSMAGGILVLSVGFVMFSTVVFLGDLEIYFLVPVSRQWGSCRDGWRGGPGRQIGGQGHQRGGGRREEGGHGGGWQGEEAGGHEGCQH